MSRVSDERLEKRIANVEADLAKNISASERAVREEGLSLLLELRSSRSRTAKVVDHVLSYPVDTSIRAEGYDVRHDVDSVRYAVALLKGDEE